MEIRTVSEQERKVPPELSTAARLGIETATQVPFHNNSSPEGSPMEPAASTKETGPDVSSIRWKAPESWKRGDERPMRLATFVPDDAPNSECVLSILTGEAGGVTANLNRWRGQLGLPPMGAGDMESLISMEVLGATAVYMECTGTPPGLEDGSNPENTLLGMVCSLPGYTLFVKMTGPSEEITREKEAYMSFVNSLYVEEPGVQ